MTIALWLAALVAGIAVAAHASRRAVGAALDISDQLGVSSGLVGVTLMAIGTDLPEIANSISASVTGHGDLNVGDSTGSTLTQVTLVLAILAFASPTLLTTDGPGERRLVVPTGIMTVAATLVIALVITDGVLGRRDGALLVSIWAISMVVVGSIHRTDRVDQSRTARAGVGRSAAVVITWLAVVAAAATLVVRAFVELTDAVGVPELVASTVVLALGTSLPELVVDWTAIRRGAAALAYGDLFGSSLVDASLSIGIGPILRPTPVSADAPITVLVVAAGVAMATVVWWLASRRVRVMAWALLAVYVSCMTVIMLLAAAG